MKISILLPTFNEEKNIRECLESVSWADEILVVDSFSNDNTISIAQSFGAKIIQHEYINSAKQKNWAIPQCKNDWIFQIDADERASIKISEEIKLLMNSKSIVAYSNPTKNHMFGTWVKTMDLYPGERIRLFNRNYCKFEDKEVDARIIPGGLVGKLSGNVCHYGMESVSQKLAPLDRYTTYEADQRIKSNRKFSIINLLFRPIAAFVAYFIIKGGWRSGVRGIILSFYKMDFVFWTYIKLWEIELKAGKQK